MKPLVSNPSGSPAVPGVVGQKCLIAVCGDDGIGVMLFYNSNAMENSFSGWPQFDFVNEP